MPITLTVVEGPHAGRSFTFHGHDTFLVGRSPDAHFSLPDHDRYFSRIHFLVEVNPPLCRLLDLKSHNGTYLNGQRVETADLAPGDLIRAGHTVLRVSLDNENPEPRPAEENEERRTENRERRTGRPRPAAPPSWPTATSPSGPDVLLDRVAALQEEAWAANRPVSVEQLLQRFPALAERPEAVVELICAEAEFRRRAGQKVRVVEYQVRFPTLAGAIRLGLLPQEASGSAASAPSPLPSRAPEPEPDPAQALPSLAGYRVRALLGCGGMGAVYHAVREADGLDVALKVIRPAVAHGASTVGRFLREARVLADLSHPHIVRFLAMGETTGLLHFVMEYVPGTDAARLAQAGGPLPVGRAVALMLPVLDALAYAHARGFVHRDLKPANILLAYPSPPLLPEAGRGAAGGAGCAPLPPPPFPFLEGGPGRVGELIPKLADFGLARTYQTSQLSGLTMAGAPGGTPAFMAPEQVRDFRGARPAADQYAAAATLDFLLTGKTLFGSAPAHEWFKRLLLEEPEPNSAAQPDVPPELAAVLRRALRVRPEQRFPDVSAFRDALRPFADAGGRESGRGQER